MDFGTYEDYIENEKEEAEKVYTIRDLLNFIGESRIQMDTRLRVTGGKYITTMTWVPDANTLFMEEEN